MYVDGCGTISFKSSYMVDIVPSISDLWYETEGHIVNVAADAYVIGCFSIYRADDYLHVTCSGWKLHVPKDPYLSEDAKRKLSIRNSSDRMYLQLDTFSATIAPGQMLYLDIPNEDQVYDLELYWTTPSEVVRFENYSIGTVSDMFRLEGCEESSASGYSSSSSSS